MPTVFFYHLTRRKCEDLVGSLAEKALAHGWRVDVRSTDPRRLQSMDDSLWSQGDASFLPHGVEGQPNDAAQPILLTLAGQERAANSRDFLLATDNALIDVSEIQSMQRAALVFDGADDMSVEAARAQWKQITSAGLRAEYWAESDSGWVQKAVSDSAAP